MAQPCAHCGSTDGPDHLCPGVTLKLIGQVLDGRYQIEDVLGQGGMGMVFRATQTSVQRPVAVKTLHPALAAAPQFFERFRREAEVASRLRHPNIITIFDFGRTSDGTCYYVMELVEGESLKQVVKREGPMPLARAVGIVEQAARALAHAHELGVIHRDIKPHNVMVQRLDQKDFVKVLDFGLVKAVEQEDDQQLTSTGQVLGTPQYMPPEQAGGEVVDQRSDLYSLGGVLYFCLTGSSPFGANTVRKALQASLTQTVAPVGKKRQGAPVPVAIDEFLRKALAREKEDRYQSAEQFIAELNAALTGANAEELEAVPSGVSPGSAAREGSNSGTSARRPSGTVAGRAGASSRRGSAPSNVIVDPQVVRSGSRGGRTSVKAPSPSPNEPGSGGALKAAFLAVPILLLGGVGAWWLTRTPADPAEQKGPMAIVAEAAAARADAPPPSPEPAAAVAPSPVVAVHLDSAPTGAAIYEGDVQIGTTPTELRLAREKVHSLTFRLAGYQPEERQLDFSRVAADTTEVNVSLQRVRPDVRPASRAAPSRPGRSEDPIPVFE